MNLNAIWEKHRNFILRVAGMAAVFLLVLWVASGYADVTVDSERNAKRANKLREDANELETFYGRVIADSISVEGKFEELSKKVSISQQTSTTVDFPKDAAASTHFRRQKERVFLRFRRQADRIGIRYPELKEINFEDLKDDDRFKDSYYSLCVLERLLSAAVEQEVQSIEKIDPKAVEFEDIESNDDIVMARYPIEVEIVVTNYRAFLGFLETFQSDRKYLTVEFTEIVPDEEVAGVLRATVTFVGIDQIPRPPEKRGAGRKRRAR